MCVCVCVCTCVCMYVCVHVCARMCTFVCTCVYMYVRACTALSPATRLPSTAEVRHRPDCEMSPSIQLCGFGEVLSPL